jgi:hypothetical protein
MLNEKGINMTKAPFFMSSFSFSGITNTSNTADFFAFQSGKSQNANLSRIAFGNAPYYSFGYDPLFYAVNGISQAVNKFGIDIKSVVNRSWVDPKSPAYADFANKRGRYFSSQPDTPNSFFFGRMNFTDDGIQNPHFYLVQKNWNTSINNRIVSLDDEIQFFTNRPIYWNLNGSTTLPRLSPITCTFRFSLTLYRSITTFLPYI